LGIRGRIAALSAVLTLALTAAIGGAAAGTANASSGGGYIYNKGSNECLDYSASYGVRVFPCNAASLNSGYQYWNWTSVQGGELVNGLVNDCLGIYGGAGQLGMGTCTKGSYQTWAQESLSANNKTYWTIQNPATNKCLDYSASAGLVAAPCDSARVLAGYQNWTPTLTP